MRDFTGADMGLKDPCPSCATLKAEVERLKEREEDVGRVVADIVSRRDVTIGELETELDRLRKTFEWALGILESLPWDEMTTADEGGQEFIDEFRRRAALKAGKEEV